MVLSNELPFDDQYPVVITQWPMMRGMGVLIGLIFSAPLGMVVYQAINRPQRLVNNLGTWLLPAVVSIVALYLVCRWIRIGGRLSSRELVLRGWFKVLRIDPAQLGEVREGHRQPFGGTERSSLEYEGPPQGSRYYTLHDHDGNLLGEIPASLLTCRNWQSFLERMQQVAANSRQAEDDQSLPRR